MGFVVVFSFPCGSNTLIEFGDTIVEVIMKKISNRKITSVMDAMLKLGDILDLLFNAIRSFLFCFQLVQQIHESKGFGLHLIHHIVQQAHQVIVCKKSYNTHYQTSYCGNHGLVNTP